MDNRTDYIISDNAIDLYTQRVRKDLSLVGRRAHSILLLYENSSMVRVVCELLSTQFYGPRVWESDFTLLCL
jgi:hypothetical protein